MSPANDAVLSTNPAFLRFWDAISHVGQGAELNALGELVLSSSKANDGAPRLFRRPALAGSLHQVARSQWPARKEPALEGSQEQDSVLEAVRPQSVRRSTSPLAAGPAAAAPAPLPIVQPRRGHARVWRFRERMLPQSARVARGQPSSAIQDGVSSRGAAADTTVACRSPRPRPLTSRSPVSLSPRQARAYIPPITCAAPTPVQRYAAALARATHARRVEELCKNLDSKPPPGLAVRTRPCDDGSAHSEGEAGEQLGEQASPTAQARFSGLLLSWGPFWHRRMEAQHQAARAERASKLKLLVAAAADGSSSDGPSTKDPQGLSQHEQSVVDMSRCLQLLDLFTLLNAETRPQRLADRVESAASAGLDPHTGLPLAAVPPPEFPASAVWDYLVAAQVALPGLVDLEASVQRMRTRLHVASVASSMAAGKAATQVTGTVEAKLRLEELAASRAAAQQAAAAQPPAGSAATGPPTIEANPAVVEDLWAWLEALVVQQAEMECGRQDVVGMVTNAKATASQFWAPPAAVNPHTEEFKPLDPVDNLVEQIAKLRAAVEEGGAQSALSSIQGGMPFTDQATLRAATLTHFNPRTAEKVLHLILQLAAAMEQGSVPPTDASFLMTSTVDILLSEVAWLLGLLRLEQGAGSPHLRVLHATLRAYEAQASHCDYLEGHMQTLRASLDAMLARALSAEEQTCLVDSRLQSAVAAVTKLELKVSELITQNVQLEDKTRGLRDQIQKMQHDAAYHLAVRQEAEVAIHELARLHRRCDKETQVDPGIIDMLSSDQAGGDGATVGLRPSGAPRKPKPKLASRMSRNSDKT